MTQEAVVDPVNLLRQEGTVNQHVEEILENHSDTYSQSHDISREDTRGLGHILQEPVNSDEELYFLSEDFYIVSTRPGPGCEEKGWVDGRKGHEVRNMAVWREEGVLPPVEETYFQGHSMAEILKEVTARHIEDGEMVVYGSMESRPGVTHLMASDLENSGESDLSGVSSYFLYEVENGEPELKESRVRDNMGGYLEELLA